MVDDSGKTGNPGNGEGSESGKGRQNSERHELTGSESRNITGNSERVEKDSEVTDPGDVPDGGYTVAPTRNNPDREPDSQDSDGGGDD
ncbi:hypothetical protein [Halostagnicola kamekurae]|uniref:hypothetical protein n=1 Tax=Halostagnicola kamekurae TaxID=619731 RepID=UPI00111392C1|nr:hypothetical protein [Halostagnicola kamekurae]